MTVATSAGTTFDMGDGKSLNLGATFRTSYTASEFGAPNGKDWGGEFKLNMARLDMKGTVSETVGFKMSTRCIGCVFGRSRVEPSGGSGRMSIVDGYLTLKIGDGLNVWVGRHLVPSTRTDMDGPDSAITFKAFTMPAIPADRDGVAGILGRDEGATLWGRGGRVHYSVGIFDGLNVAPNYEDAPLVAGRLTFDLLNVPSNFAYFSEGTYYGAHGRVFTVGAAGQQQTNGAGISTAPKDYALLSADAFFETVFENGGVVNAMAEYRSMSGGTTAAFMHNPTCHCLFDGDAFVTSVSYLTASNFGHGRLQPYLRYQAHKPSGSDFDDTSRMEAGVNWLIEQHRFKVYALVANGNTSSLGYSTADKQTEFLVAIQLQL